MVEETGEIEESLESRSWDHQAFLSNHLLGSVRPILDYLRDDGALSVEIKFTAVLPHEPYDSGVTHAPCEIKAVFQRPRHLTTAALGAEAQGHKQEKAERDQPGESMVAPDLRYWSAR